MMEEDSLSTSSTTFESRDGAKAAPSLATAVKAAREALSYSIDDLAVTSGLTADEISAIERGAEADPIKVRRIAAALRMPAWKMDT
ncbi:hypothetical protein N182_28140 [Sinorhizobium sp. GL2]|nr:hypothetical protein N182_28140 [Sinorhizobium sp. GL2]